MFDTLAVPIKNELRKSRGAMAYESVFEMAFTDLIAVLHHSMGGDSF